MTHPLLQALIVEDDPQLCQIFALTLEDNFAVSVVSDGQAALAHLAEHTPVLVILDLNLPGVNGRQVLEFIRSEPRLAQVTVFLATADAAQADLLQQDADLVLLKPISPVQLASLAARFSTGA